MKSYSCKNIRNIALAGHGSSGKTALAEALLFKSGAVDRMGKTLDGNTVMDYDPEEIKRKISLATSLASTVYNDVKINIIDTPGQFDFAGGFYEGMKGAETVLIAVPAKDGVEVGTIKAYKDAIKNNKATMFVVTKMEEEHSDFYNVLTQLKTQFGPSICPVIVPFDKYGTVESYINLIELKAYTYDVGGKATEVDMPASENRIAGLRAAMAEAVAETDEELMEKFFEGEEFTQEELVKGLRAGVSSGSITPLVCCSNDTLASVDSLLDIIVDMLPSPACRPVVENEKTYEYDENKPLKAYVFKTIADPFVGKMSYIKIIQGKLTAKSEPINATTNEHEKLGKLVCLRGKKQEDVAEALAGDIVAVTKLNANTSDTLCAAEEVVALEPIKFPQPCYFMAVRAKGKGDESKISSGIQRLLEEDKTLSYTHDAETREQIIGGLGEQHLDVSLAKLKTKFGVEVELSEPIIAYREAIRKKVSVEGKHRKQSGGHGQYGHVKIEFEPHDGDELIFEERVFGGSVPKNYFPAVEKGLQDSVSKGVVLGYPVVRLKATLFDGSYHAVDSSEMAFKLAASIAFKEGMRQGSPCILEPINTYKILVEDKNTGDIIGLINKRRGSVLGMNPSESEEGMTEITSEIPVREATDFALVIRQISSGMGSFISEFARYEQLPANLEEEVKASAKKDLE